jgi:hypothetical protein
MPTTGAREESKARVSRLGPRVKTRALFRKTL